MLENEVTRRMAGVSTLSIGDLKTLTELVDTLASIRRRQRSTSEAMKLARAQLPLLLQALGQYLSKNSDKKAT